MPRALWGLRALERRRVAAGASGATRGATPEERAAHELLETRFLNYGEQVYSQLYDHAFLMTGETGAYKYMAPEVFKNELYGLKCDVYSFAMIAYEVFEGIMLLRDPVSWAHGARWFHDL